LHFPRFDVILLSQADKEALLSESEPISLRPGYGSTAAPPQRAPSPAPAVVTFNRRELFAILDVYGRRVAEGEWRDYAIDHGRETAAFSIFRRSSECPIYRIEKTPKLARKQGQYSVVAATGLILKRGNELDRVLAVLDKRVRLVV
jgi:hypothetical protein